MDFAEAVAVFVSGVFTCGMVDGFVLKAPLLETVIDVVFIRINLCALGDSSKDEWLDSRLLYVIEQSVTTCPDR